MPPPKQTCRMLIRRIVLLLLFGSIVVSEDFLSILAAQQQRVCTSQSAPNDGDEVPFDNLTGILEGEAESFEGRAGHAADLRLNVFDCIPHATITHFDPPIFFSFSTATLPSLGQLRI